MGVSTSSGNILSSLSALSRASLRGGGDDRSSGGAQSFGRFAGKLTVAVHSPGQSARHIYRHQVRSSIVMKIENLIIIEDTRDT